MPATAITPTSTTTASSGRRNGVGAAAADCLDYYSASSRRRRRRPGEKRKDTLQTMIRERQAAIVRDSAVVSPDGGDDDDRGCVDVGATSSSRSSSSRSAASSPVVLPTDGPAGGKALRSAAGAGAGAAVVAMPVTPDIDDRRPRRDEQNDERPASSARRRRCHHSPVATPAARDYMERASPFKSSMRLLDERLLSVRKMEGRLDCMIDGMVERMERSYDDEEEGDTAGGDDGMMVYCEDDDGSGGGFDSHRESRYRTVGKTKDDARKQMMMMPRRDVPTQETKRTEMDMTMDSDYTIVDGGSVAAAAAAASSSPSSSSDHRDDRRLRHRLVRRFDDDSGATPLAPKQLSYPTPNDGSGGAGGRRLDRISERPRAVAEARSPRRSPREKDVELTAARGSHNARELTALARRGEGGRSDGAAEGERRRSSQRAEGIGSERHEKCGASRAAELERVDARRAETTGMPSAQVPELKSGEARRASELEGLNAELRRSERKRADELESLRREMEASASLALEERVRQMSIVHASQLEELRVNLQSSHAAELERVRSEAKAQHAEELDRLRNDVASAGMSVKDEGQQPSASRLESEDHGHRVSEEHATSIGSAEAGGGDLSFSFYVGTEEGYIPSESIHHSDISETASDSDGDESDFTVNESNIIESSIEEELESTDASLLKSQPVLASAKTDGPPSQEVNGRPANESPEEKSCGSFSRYSHSDFGSHEDRVRLCSELGTLSEQLEAIAAEDNSTNLIRDDSLIEIQELRRECGSQLDGAEKAELIQSRDKAREIALKLATTVLKLKIQRKKGSDERRKLREQISTSEEVNADMNSLTAKPVQLNSMSITTKEDEYEGPSLVIAKLALTLAKLKAREMNLSKEKSRLDKENTELRSNLNRASSERNELNQRLTALSDKNDSLRDELESNLQEIQRYCIQNESLLGDLKLKESEQARSNELISQLQRENEDHKETGGILKMEIAASSKKTEAALSELEGANILAERRLDEKIQMQEEIDQLRDDLAEIEGEKDLLVAKLSDCEDHATLLSHQVVALESKAKSNEGHIDDIESQLASATHDADALRVTVGAHETSLNELHAEMNLMEKQKAAVEDTLSDLHRKIDRIVGERDDLAQQLEQAIKDLESVRAERSALTAQSADVPVTSTASYNSSFNELSLRLDDSSDKMKDIVNLSCISEEDLDAMNSRLGQAKSIIAEIGRERKLLKKEVKHLRANLEKTKGELATAQDDCKKVRGQAMALRDVVSQARSLLEKGEEEKRALTSDLENAYHELKRVKRHSSDSATKSQDEINKLRMEFDSYKSTIARSQDEINMLKLELQQRNKSTNLVAVSGSQKAIDSEPKLSSKDRFKVEKGSMFSVLKDMKKSGRKDTMKYRKAKEES